MSGTNFPTGLVTRKKFDGDVTDSRLAADTKFINKTAVIRCTAQTSETEVDFTLPATAIVKEVWINVIAIDDTETVDVGTTGTSNDPNGFLAAASLDDLGLVYGSLLDGSVTRGDLLSEITEATTAAARRPCITAGGDTISYTCSAGSDTAVFDIIIEYVEVVVEAN